MRWLSSLALNRYNSTREGAKQFETNRAAKCPNGHEIADGGVHPD